MDSSPDPIRPHRTLSINSSTATATATSTPTSSELFICFTSRLSSSSSMKLPSSSSKSILSPARARDKDKDRDRDAPPPSQISLSSSLSRRLRTNGSLKGGQASPMFPAGGKKRGGAGFDNPEPSSPKVTCIGQVRVKTKKQGKKLRTRSKRKGEVSFRKLELSRSGHHSFPPQNGNPECLPHRNQRWVHFPVTICEALRTFGAEWNCFLPCRSSCMSSKADHKGGQGATAGSDSAGGGNGGSSCGAVIARWLVAVHEGEGRDRREIELVVGGEEIPAETHDDRSRSQRRHVFEGLEFNEDEICRERKEAEEEEEQGRVSICIPPKNALLLMRCRSDPVKMAALANRFCGSPVPKDEQEEEEGKDYEDCREDGINDEKVVEEVNAEGDVEDSKEEVSEQCWVTAEASEEQRTVEAESSLAVAAVEVEVEQEVDQEIETELPKELDNNLEEEGQEEEDRPEVPCASAFEALLDHEDEHDHGEEEEEPGAAQAELLAENQDGVDFDDELGSKQSKLDTDVEEDERARRTNILEKAPREPGETAQQTVGDESSEPENPEPDDSGPDVEAKGRDSIDREPKVLPECLLLMMCEPKLSMEVSKETWICSTDFIRWLPERHVNKVAAGGGDPKKRTAAAAPDNKRSASALTAQQTRILQQPPRSSCSFPSQAAAVAAGMAKGGGESMAAMIEQKLQNAKAGEPLVLTRCKSEPMRAAAMKRTPDACFWKNRKLEPHRPSTNLRVKAAGVGF